MILKEMRRLQYDFGDLLIEEFDGHSMWAAGDPVPTSNETLVIRVAERWFDEPSA